MAHDPAVLRPLSDPLIIPATRGERTIARAKDVFSIIHPDFTVWQTDVPEKARKQTTVKVYDLRRDANFADMFRNGDRKPDRFALTQEQIIVFVEKYPTQLRFAFATFLLFKVRQDFFVARASLDREDRPKILPCQYSDTWPWSTCDKHRVVLPV